MGSSEFSKLRDIKCSCCSLLSLLLLPLLLSSLLCVLMFQDSKMFVVQLLYAREKTVADPRCLFLADSYFECALLLWFERSLLWFEWSLLLLSW